MFFFFKKAFLWIAFVCKCLVSVSGATREGGGEVPLPPPSPSLQKPIYMRKKEGQTFDSLDGLCLD